MRRKKTADHIPELDINKHLETQADTSLLNQFMLEIDTPDEWGVAKAVIEAFEKRYSRGMRAYLAQNQAMRQKYNLADGDLGKSGFRNTLSFPIMRNQFSGDEDCLLGPLESIFPDLRKNGSKTYHEFCRRFPQYLVPEKV